MKRTTLLALALLLPCACTAVGERPTSPNVILIFTDDLGYGDLACYGAPNIATPHLDRLAAGGARFTSFCVAASVCTPSRAALLTGRYPIRNIPHNVGPESGGGLPLGEVTIAQDLRARGYRTMAVGKWHLGHAEPGYLPTSRGFERFVGLPYSNDMILPWCPWLSEDDRLHLYRQDRPVSVVDYDQGGLTELYTEEALRFIEDSAGEPFFLYLAHSMPHLPISVSERFAGRSDGGLYGDVIECIDWSVGEILARLEQLGIADDTLVLFTSDNGPWQDLPERMVQRGIEPWHVGSAGDLRGSKGTTWEGGFRVPAIAHWPARIAPGQVLRGPASTMDLHATIAAVTGVPAPAGRVLDGVDLMPRLTGAPADDSRPFFYYQGRQLQGMRRGPWKLRIAAPGEVTLFHLEDDPAERHDRAADHPELVVALHRSMQRFAAEAGGTVHALERP